MLRFVFFHRNKTAGFSIDKVTQNIIKNFNDREEYYAPCYNASPFSILKNIIYVFCHRQKNAINHVTGDIHYCILGLIKCKSVLTIHDTVSLDFNKYSSFYRFVLEWLWYRIPLYFAKNVVCISEETKKSVMRFSNRKDIRVIYNAVDPKMVFAPKKINLQIPRILIIGTNPNKNIERTIEALAGIECIVVIVGVLNETHKKLLQRNNTLYENKYNLSDDEIIEEYKKCDIVSFVSLYEGFGMPIIEANAIGRPVICSDIPVLHEVANDAAAFVNPYDVEEIRKTFCTLKSSSYLCQDLIEKGQRNICRFEQSKILKEWSDFYSTIM